MAKQRKSKFQYSMFKMHPSPKVLRTCWYLSFRQSCRAPQLPNGPPSFCALIYRTCSEWYQTLPKCSLRISSSIWIWLEDYFPMFLKIIFWCGQEDKAVPRELFRDRFLQVTHHTVRGEIAIDWDEEAKPVATIPSSRRKHSYMAHRPAVHKDSPPPSLDSWFSWTLGAQRISQEGTGLWQAVRRILCSEDSTEPGGQTRGDSQAGSWNPFWQLAFSFLFTCGINFVAIFAFWGSLPSLWWWNKI